ncbi:MAG: T9SS type A sorting domain-containing protein [Sphingobacteriales bacterium]|nr:T9SS type A sorting domain-containing protein [Sphingobacteriales bacterium]
MVEAEIISYNTSYVIVPILVPQEGNPTPQFEPLCIGSIQTDGSYPYIAFAQPIAPGEGCVACEAAGGTVTLAAGSTNTLCETNLPQTVAVGVSGQNGNNYAYFVTDADGQIVSSLSATGTLSFNTDFAAGTYRIYGIAYDNAVVLGNTIAEIAGTCFEVSNSFVSVTIENAIDCADPCESFSITVANAPNCNYGGQITFGTNGGTPPIEWQYNFVYNDLVQQNANGTYTAVLQFEESYQITATDANGCVATFNDSNNCPDPCADNNTPDFFVNTICNEDGTATLFINYPQDIGIFVLNATHNNGAILNNGESYSITTLLEFGCGGTVSGTIDCPVVVPCENSTLALAADVTCGNGNGLFYLTASGGTAPYEFSGVPSGSTLQHNETYNATVTDADGCTASVQGIINCPPTSVCENSTLALAADVTCGNGNGLLNLTVSGGTAPYEFSGVPSGSTLQHNETYNATVTDADGCTASVQGTINCPPTSVCENSTLALAADVTCGNGNGLLYLTASGGTAPYEFSGVPSGSTLQHNETYNATVTDADGCTASVQGTINCPPTSVCENSTLALAADVTCGNGNGLLNLTASGGTAPYEFSGVPSGSTLQHNETYNATVIDADGCTASVQGTINCPPTSVCENSTLALAADVTCGNGNGLLNLTASGGTAPYFFTGTANNATVAHNETYYATVTDANGCNVTVQGVADCPYTNPCADNDLSLNVNVACGNGNGIVTFTASGGTEPYFFTGTANNATVAHNETYYISMTDANGCSYVEQGTINCPPIDPCADVNISIEHSYTCNNDGTATLQINVSGGTPPYFYSSAQNGDVYPNGSTYQVNVSDANGCSASATGTIEEAACPTCFLFEVNNVSTECLNDGVFIAYHLSNGTPPYNYTYEADLGGGEVLVVEGTLNSNSSSFTGLMNVPYKLQFVDANGCETIYWLAATICTPALSAQSFAICNEDNDAFVVLLNIEGGEAPYTLSGSVEADNIMGNSYQTAEFTAGSTYEITVSDAQGNATTVSGGPISCKVQPCSSLSVTHDVTCDETIGKFLVDVAISGGNPPYTIEGTVNDILYVAGNFTIGPLTGGSTYSISVVDNEGCTFYYQSPAIPCKPDPCALMNFNAYSCLCQGSNSQLQFTLNGGEAPFAYSITNSNGEVVEQGSSNMPNFNIMTTALCEDAAFEITITDNNDCSFSKEVLCEGPTAVDLLRFEGEALENANELHWQSASEYNLLFYALERSADGINFEDIATIQAAANGTTTGRNYHFTDKKAPQGIAYYRLRMENGGGEPDTYSQTISLLRGKPELSVVSVGPVPAQDAIYIHISSNTETVLQTTMYDVNGKLVTTQAYNLQNGSQSFRIDRAGWAAGIYFLHLSNAEQQLNQLYKIVLE